jgi:hypothetical protein
MNIRERNQEEMGGNYVMRSLVSCTLAHIKEIKCRDMRWVGEMRNPCRVLIRKLEGKRPHGKLRHRFPQ